MTASTPRASPEMMQFIGWASIVFFGLCAAIILYRLLTSGRPVVTLSPAGLRDTRVSPDLIPWSAIASIGSWSHSGQSMIVLSLHPGEEEKLHLTPIARMTRGANAKLGADGLAIAATGTTLGFDALMAAAVAYAKRYGS